MFPYSISTADWNIFNLCLPLVKFEVKIDIWLAFLEHETGLTHPNLGYLAE